MKISRKTIFTPWLFGATISTAMFLFLWVFGDIHFTGNDDTFILRTFMGYTGGVIPTFLVYINALLVYPLHWLGTAFPGVPWFSWMQIFFLWLSCTVICKSIVRCFLNRAHSFSLGGFVSIVFMLTLILHYSNSITYTVTAAMLGAAAVAQMMSIDYSRASNGQIIRGMLLSLLLVVLGYSLREMTAMPTLAFCGIAYLYHCAEHFGFGKKAKRSLKPMLITLIIVVVVMGSLVGLREWEINAKGMRDHIRWQEARTEVMDYLGTENLSQELMDEIGWTELERRLVTLHWYLIDDNIDTEAFEKIAEYQKAQQSQQTHHEKLADSMALLSTFLQEEPTAIRSLLLILFALLVCILGLLFQRKGTLWRWLCLILALLLACMMLAYLSLQGRFLLRGVLSVGLPYAALLFCMMGASMPTTTHPRNLYCGTLTIVLTAFTVFYLTAAMPEILKEPVDHDDPFMQLDIYQSLDDYALSDPDILYIYDSTLILDTRMFPDTDEGVPQNVLFWGGWGCRTPEYMKLLESFGIDGHTADATILLHDNVRLARGVLDPGPNLMRSYLEELTGEYVDYYPESEYDGIHIISFY